MNKPKVGIIIGSVRKNRIGFDIADWIKSNLDSSLFETELIDLRYINLPNLDEPEIPAKGNYQNKSTIKWSNKINDYKAIIVLTPQYNWGIPASLKNAIDFVYSEWKNKPLSVISYGYHGGTQARISLDLSLIALKVNKLAVNFGMDISDDMFENYKFINIDKSLDKYKFSIHLLKEELENLI
ncbi:NADPH-dependent FMN reductase [Lactobacillus sp. S2-2]|uniref:NADPH-dependent FMN reductase n=1 Tax=Lactobacillus sp. S2-2 TaxID=2692917 RepID=UPI001F22930D|nr:NAD(P)H-dependent oxidoreductase [Lactobacillus sp. S2-2]MCF6515727.1 NADPH-dependent FMN reductase [Lactobacillus sp. S2-2]